MVRSVDTIHDYFEHVVTQNYSEHFSENASIRTAFNLAVSISALRDWAFNTHVHRFARCLETNAQNWKANPKSQSQESLELQCGDLRHVHRIANASKHYTLRKNDKVDTANKPSDLVNKATAFGTGPYSGGRYGGLRFVVSTPNSEIDFDDTLKTSFSFWTTLLADFPRD
ncbi:hypothetical protein [Celeribacter marinus]|uniref:hypothetical protein n=1 Tax=Celeribacter marinus TaxID=1397108 RepID=UPI003F6B6D8E